MAASGSDERAAESAGMAVSSSVERACAARAHSVSLTPRRQDHPGRHGGQGGYGGAWLHFGLGGQGVPGRGGLHSGHALPGRVLGVPDQAMAGWARLAGCMAYPARAWLAGCRERPFAQVSPTELPLRAGVCLAGAEAGRGEGPPSRISPTEKPLRAGAGLARAEASRRGRPLSRISPTKAPLRAGACLAGAGMKADRRAGWRAGRLEGMPGTGLSPREMAGTRALAFLGGVVAVSGMSPSTMRLSRAVLARGMLLAAATPPPSPLAVPPAHLALELGRRTFGRTLTTAAIGSLLVPPSALAALGAAAPTLAAAAMKTRVFEVRTPALELRQFRALLLPNGLRVLLASDKEAERAAAALCVRAGYFDDPAGVPGLAHFCEHMLFLGTILRQERSFNDDMTTILAACNNNQQ
ncbi:hypothetical protein T492DRAFT_1141127 [Pavlovales sp. CCMP2436]|nr:hypothetical protein T492DRAFT_1141127 [Pavlovales sp. CCMP2436]